MASDVSQISAVPAGMTGLVGAACGTAQQAGRVIKFQDWPLK